MTEQTLPQERRKTFPNLTDNNHSVTSPETDEYNCIAWAYEVSNKWMWPGALDYYSPYGLTRSDDLAALVQLYLGEGYAKCEHGEPEEGYKKVAIYVNQEGPQHAALQLESGKWTSKLGDWEDIRHDTLEALEGQEYGKATIFLKKRRA
ncbi:MAG: hypothetical protein HY670_00560 [Chloroflexi bacterium]|nr:hypothetical protein [Chloroflexota bacterium]